MGSHYDKVQEFYANNPGARQRELEDANSHYNQNAKRFGIIRTGKADTTPRERCAQFEDMGETLEPKLKELARMVREFAHAARDIVLD